MRLPTVLYSPSETSEPKSLIAIFLQASPLMRRFRFVTIKAAC